MTESAGFAFRSGSSFLHKLDVRFKLIMLMILSLVCIKAYFMGLALLTFILIAAVFYIPISIISFLKEIRYFFLLLLFVFLARSLSIPGTPYFEFMNLTITIQGVSQGVLVCWRLMAVVLICLCFMATSRVSEIRGAVVLFLKPVPFIPEKRVGTMLSLVLRFIPAILNQASKTSEAQRARGIECRKNPVYRLVKFTIPFMRRIFEDADRLVIAMEARCYSEERTDPEFSSQTKDWIALITVIVFSLLISFL